MTTQAKAINVARKGAYLVLSAPGTDEEVIAAADNDAEVAAALRDLLTKAVSAEKARRVVHEATVVEEQAEEPSSADEEAGRTNGRERTVGDVLEVLNTPEMHEKIASGLNFLEKISIKRKAKDG